MSQSHYFNPDPSLEHQHQTIEYSLSRYNFLFKTDKGVFSKDKVDHGTNVMLKAILKDQNNFPEQAEITALDFGCGYGVVSIVLQEIFANENYFKKQNWFGLDINPRAIALAKQNAKNQMPKLYFWSQMVFQQILENLILFFLIHQSELSKLFIIKCFNKLLSI